MTRIPCPDCDGIGRITRTIPGVPPEVCVRSSPCPRCWPRNDDGIMKSWNDGTAGTIDEEKVRLPIRIPCEGSDHPTHQPSMNGGTCKMCGVLVTCRDDGTAWPHERNDIIAMLERGDFDR